MAARGLFVACLVVAAAAALSVPSASAFVFKAGGTGEWRVPAAASTSNASSPYNAWAQRNRFRVGDAIAFTYQPGKDSVLVVDKRSYDACDTTSPIDTFSDGNTVFTFTRSGPYYFISGNKDNCNSNEKLIVVVMAARSAVNNGTVGPSPSPNSPFSPPSPPPPPLVVGISPAANPPPNAAAPKVAGFAGTVALAMGALFYALV